MDRLQMKDEFLKIRQCYLFLKIIHFELIYFYCPWAVDWAMLYSSCSGCCLIVASVKLPPEKFSQKKEDGSGPSDVPSEPKKIILNSGDELYADLRDKNFNAVGAIVSRKAKVITAEFDVSTALG